MSHAVTKIEAAPARGVPRIAVAALMSSIAIALVAPIWIVAFPPLLDYPNHLARAFVLAHPQAYSFAQYYRPDWGIYPYLGMDLIIIGVQKFFQVEQSGRIFLTLLVLAFPLCAWFFLREANPGQDSVAFWTVVATYNVFFLQGFLNFYLSMALAFLALGLWLRDVREPRPTRFIAALLAFLALYCTHLLGFGIAGLVVGAYLVCSRAAWRQWRRTGLLFVPMAALYAYWSRVDAGAQGAFTFRPWRDKLEALHAIMHGYSDTLDIATAVAFVVFIIAAAYRNPDFRCNRAWLGVAALLFVAYWLLPLSRGEGFDFDIRVLPVLFIVLLATVRVGRRAHWLIAIPLLLFAMRMADTTKNFKAAQPELQAIAKSFELVPATARVLPIIEVDQDEPIRRPFAHFWAYGVIRRGWFSPYLFDIKGVTPLRVNDDVYAPDGFWDLSYDPEIPDWKQVQENYDYLWTYNVERFSTQLERIGQPIYTSGHFKLYRVTRPPER